MVVSLFASTAVLLDLGIASTWSLTTLLLGSSPPIGVAVSLLLTAPLLLAAALAFRRTPWPLVAVCALLITATAAVLARYGHLRDVLVPAGVGYAVLLALTAAAAGARAARIAEHRRRTATR